MKICLSLSFLLYATFCFAQIDNPDNLRAKIFELKVKTVPPVSLQLPFETIKIIDRRSDTSKLGFRINTRLMVTVNKVFEKIMLKPGIERGIETFYNEYYKNSFTQNGSVLLISIRKLWINNLPERKGQKKDIDHLSQQNIYAKFEYYLGSGNSYVPMKRIDTIFQLTPDKKVEGYDPKDENKLPFFCFALEKMIENVNYGYYMNDLGRKKKMSVEDIEKYNATNKNIPIVNEPIKKGVFLTFNEFKNNVPSLISFNKRKIPKRKIYEITDEKDNVILDYFAYYDGEKLAIAKHLSGLFNSNISQDNYGIYKVGSSFQFFENHILNNRQEVGVSDSRPVQNRTNFSNIVWVPRQIDMETGEIY